MKYMPNLPVRPEVLAGEGMLTGECAVETEVGAVDLGVRAQLSEIERGFFDRASASLLPNVDSHSRPKLQEVLL
jgi:flagellar assembly protein FliH